MIYVCSTSNIVHPPFKDSLWKKAKNLFKKKTGLPYQSLCKSHI